MTNIKPLAVRLHALRLSTLRLMAQASAEDPDSILRVKRRWAYFKKRAAEEATEEGESYELVRSFYSTEEFRNYKTVQRATDPYFETEKYRERHRSQNQAWYASKGSEARKTPEARARLADARRRQREAKRASVGGTA